MNTQQQHIIPVLDRDSYRRVEPEQLEKTLLQAIIDDPLIENASNISVSYRRKGMTVKDDQIHLIGKVASREEAKRAYDIVRSNTNGEIEIENELRVG